MISIETDKLTDIIHANRESLAAITCWISDSDYEHSVFNYGLPRSVRHLIDAAVGYEPTYTDVLAFLATGLAREARYLEIGVSVGKNFFQMLRFLRNAQLTGVDIENINPVLEQFLTPAGRTEWPTVAGSLRKMPSSITDYHFRENNNQVRYLAGDVFDDRTWTGLSGSKFNLIFSDAFHSGAALTREWNFIKKLELLDPSEFAMVWDDLGEPEMQAAFRSIAGEMQQVFSIPADDVVLGSWRGWLGMNEGHHPVGIVMKRRESRESDGEG